MSEKKMEITRIDPLMLGKVNALFGFIVGLVVGVLTLLTSGIVSGYLQTLSGVDVQLVQQTQQFGFLGLIFFLVLGAFLGFVSGAAGAVIYNVAAKIVGGIKVWVEE
ncbi:MAG: DUF3566 domain-containing protein [Candidatus Diapherotrites archaeon]